MIQRNLINLHLTEYSQEFHYYPFVVKLDRYVRSCNTLNDLSDKLCASSKTRDLNLSVFNTITGINESKSLAKNTSCECKCKFDGRKCNSDQWWNNDRCWCECKKCHVWVKKIMFGILLNVVVKTESICHNWCFLNKGLKFQPYLCYKFLLYYYWN